MPALKQEARRLNLSECVTFGEEIDGALAMAAFDVFALSSRYEGFPYVLLEALAMGLPIVSTDVGGAAAVIRSGENGFVVPVGAVSDLAEALRKLTSDDELRDSMAAKSLWRSEMFSLDRMLNETLAVYEYGVDFKSFPTPAAVGSDQATPGLAELASALADAQPPRPQITENVAPEKAVRRD
jgi:glycosyltransferase involved in cell wall biosynthesis